MEWIAPKTDWNEQSRMNAVDYNRIKNNLQVLAELVGSVYCTVTIAEMGEDKEFNRFESNLEIINQAAYQKDIGDKKTFFDNGPFIDYKELNRIESSMLEFYERASLQKKTLPRLSFRMGNVKGV